MTNKFDFIKVGVGEDNYLQVDYYGELSLQGKATAWDDLRTPLTQTKIGANGKPDFDETNLGYLFPASNTAEILYGVAQLPHSWKEGSTIYPHVHWQQTADSAIVFKINYKWFNMNTAPPAAWSTATMSTKVFTYSSGSLHQLSGTGTGIDGTGKTLSSIILFKLFRDDAVAGDILTWEFDIHYEIARMGTKEIAGGT